MRARKKKNTVPRLERVKEYLTDHIEPNDTLPVHVEVGCGKGAFALFMAQYTECMYYALEKVPDVMVMAVEKGAAAELKNIRYVLADASMLPEICPEGAVDVLYLNFSDPWPKKRLTHGQVLALLSVRLYFLRYSGNAQHLQVQSAVWQQAHLQLLYGTIYRS